MPAPTQTELVQHLRQERDPARQCDRALALLAATRSREHVDLALRTLAREDVIAWLDDRHRPILREKAAYYFEHPARDRGGLVREQITRLLLRVGHPGDLDLYLQGVTTYHRQPETDSAQNLRAAALVGLAGVDESLAAAHAVRLLGERDTSPLSGEPSMTALAVLARLARPLPIYQFLLLAGERFLGEGKGEVVGRALEVLGAALPLPVYTDLAERFAGLDVPVASMGIITAITEERLEPLYNLLERIINETRDGELFRYGLIMLAAARDDTLTRMLYRLARISPRRHVSHCLEAVELTPESDERDELLRALRRRV
jgi:hypothetical protein